jgi:hypothetical protein
MRTMPRARAALVAVSVVVALGLGGCTTSTPRANTGTPSTASPAPTAGPTASDRATDGTGPRLRGVALDAEVVPRYGRLEMTVEVDATYDNPFDGRQVALDAVFTGPDGAAVTVPGFWDAESAWRIRFTPHAAGTWQYSITLADVAGEADPLAGRFEVAASDAHGWLQVGSWVDPGYSARYLAHHDGTPWYGRGHADLEMTLGGLDLDDGFRYLTDMAAAGENYTMWWPLWAMNFIQNGYDAYGAAQLHLIDLAVEDAAAKDVVFVFTIWNHQLLRTGAHPWQNEKWPENGFSELTDIKGFFTDDEAWAWQENLYRYVIARWSYSPAIGMWQTVSEINGTESYEYTDTWHQRVNGYFVEHDPYRHPTTATQSGSVDWPAGHAVMDAPQMHVYEFVEDPVEAAERMAGWTELMWDRVAKPNWVGEYGEQGPQFYPELFHAANWASLASGAAMTPTEWNDGFGYGFFTDEMAADMSRFARFVDAVPLAALDPSALDVTTSDPAVRAWAVAGTSGGVVWVQDFALEGATMDVIRADATMRRGVTITLDGLAPGRYTVTPYDTWQGDWLEAIHADCAISPCSLVVPDFHSDVALGLSVP